MFRSVLVFLFLPIFAFSQQPDSRESKMGTTIFGSDCESNTMTVTLDNDGVCVLDAEANKFYRIKKERVVWEVNLSEFGNADYMCLVIHQSSSKRKYSIFILAYKNENEIGRKLVQYPSGKVLSTTLSDAIQSTSGFIE